MTRVRIQEADFDVGAELAALQGARTDIGAVASFVGCVRGHTRADDVSALTLEHYPGMTERAIEAMIAAAEARFSVQQACIVHRVGRLLPGERIVLVAVASAHRRDAFQACEFLMDYLKTQAPFWKKESTPAGEHWVDARVADDAALARWGLVSTNAAPGADAIADAVADAVADATADAGAGANADAGVDVDQRAGAATGADANPDMNADAAAGPGPGRGAGSGGGAATGPHESAGAGAKGSNGVPSTADARGDAP